MDEDRAIKNKENALNDEVSPEELEQVNGGTAATENTYHPGAGHAKGAGSHMDIPA